MLVMITHIQRHNIEPPVVASGLLSGIKRVMLLYPSAAQRVKTHGEEHGPDQIDYAIRASDEVDHRGKCGACCIIQPEPRADKSGGAEAEGTQCLEDGEEQQPKRLSVPGIA